jgi:hypothetical protein
MSFDTNDVEKEIKLIDLKDDETFNITDLENSYFEYEYVIVFGKYYKVKDYKEITNFMILVRKSDLSFKYYPIDGCELNKIDIRYGQYMIKDNKMMLVNSQEDKSFITLEFVKDKKINNVQFNKKSMYTSTVSLRVRESADTSAKIITTLTQGSKVEVLEKGKSDTINNIKGNWVKVKTEKGETGWCFDGYLEEVK